MVRTVMQEIVAFYPATVRDEIVAVIPTLSLHAVQLGLEVMLAEQQGVRYSEAVLRPEFGKMARVYFGASNLLQWRLPSSIRDALNRILDHAAAGGFDPSRKLIFAIATRKNDPEAALCRFLLWLAVRLNVLVLTWHAPEVEALGTLQQMEDEAEVILRELLDVGDMLEPDVRPLNVLVAEMMSRTSDAVKQRLRSAVGEFGGEFTELLTNAEALGATRRLDGRDAVMFSPGRSVGPMGSQQIADRYPQHFASANAMEQRRSRFLAKGPLSEPPEDRLIDLIAHEGEAR